MKKEGHPKYFKTVVKCACGETFHIGSTQENIRVDICSSCHPLFTGKQRLLDSEGRIKKFERKFASVKSAPSAKKKKIIRKKKSASK